MANRRVEFSEESGKRIAESVRKSEHASGPPLPAPSNGMQHPQKIFRVKLLGDIQDDQPATGTRQIQNEDGEIDWLDIDDAVIGDIYKGLPDQPDFVEDDIVWVTNHRGRWFVLHSGDGLREMVNKEDIFLGPMTITGVTKTANCTFSSDTSISPDEGVDVKGDRLGTLIPPSAVFYAKKDGEHWYAVSGGFATYKGVMQDDLLHITNDAFPPITVDVEVTAGCTDEDLLVEGQHLIASVTYGFEGVKLMVVKDCCPPDPD